MTRDATRIRVAVLDRLSQTCRGPETESNAIGWSCVEDALWP